ncbi:hypothetical protein ACV3WI_08800 [Clostridium perfringens]|uniref:hypothetical protein n=1 Tax=Clostridium perfringens TaxID=1502 RepID=UPI0018E490AB|nr:hypothetical protein [Clostridium perfringens]MBI6076704.1 hypothetical protein [Clostridium perfringens]MDK0765001.1 hypothetical protein [Clostridium perfringens]MDK0913251.1 hypothetical protein [Clostridium perfringens]MDK0950828.1 hypothetical protein [Clostridium perfringens]MDM0742142.1 hypothetical protein [Clostridium perfringens]
MLEILCTSQIQVTEVLKKEIKKYENGCITEEELSRNLTKIFFINKEIIYKNEELGSIIIQRLGKKRIRLIKTLIFKNGE